MQIHLTPKDIERFWPKVNRSRDDGGCWLWMAGTLKGYGTFSVSGQKMLAHRVAWIIANDAIPENCLVCHNCPGGDNPLCVNPAHLWAGTHAENAADMVAKNRQAKGDRNGARLYPESRVRGDQHHARLRPECMSHGEDRYNSKLTVDGVREIRQRHADGVSQRTLAEEFGVSQVNIGLILRRTTWKAVP